MPAFFSGISLWSLILLIAGVGFLIGEIFHPGFGLPGILGLLALGLDILISARTLAQGLLMTAVAAVIVLVVFLVGASLFSKGKPVDQSEEIARLESLLERYKSDEFVRDWE